LNLSAPHPETLETKPTSLQQLEAQHDVGVLLSRVVVSLSMIVALMLAGLLMSLHTDLDHQIAMRSLMMFVLFAALMAMDERLSVIPYVIVRIFY
jgi:hypothetical protein